MAADIQSDRNIAIIVHHLHLILFSLQIKDQSQKTEFLESLNTEIENFPASFSKNKILPLLVQAFEYGAAGANVLMPLLKVRLSVNHLLIDLQLIVA